jgi:hypothetical protein
MTTMSPDEARREILEGTAPDGLSVGGALGLRGCTGLTVLPEGLSVGDWLDINGCTGLTVLPEGLSVGGSLYLGGCTGLTALPEGLSVGGSLDLSGCTGLTALPEGLSVGGSSLYLIGCTGLTALMCDARGFWLYRVILADGEWFFAGCRKFRRDEAIAHWGSPGYPDPARGAKYVAAIEATEPTS